VTLSTRKKEECRLMAAAKKSTSRKKVKKKGHDLFEPPRKRVAAPSFHVFGERARRLVVSDQINREGRKKFPWLPRTKKRMQTITIAPAGEADEPGSVSEGSSHKEKERKEEGGEPNQSFHEGEKEGSASALALMR